MKQKWEKPELIVLVRNRPAEGVLWACKLSSRAGAHGQSLCSYPSECWSLEHPS
jgi:hypothetical protein